MSNPLLPNPEIARKALTGKAYTAEVLRKQAVYVELFTENDLTRTAYARFFRFVASVNSVEDAQSSVQRLHHLRDYFTELGDYEGQHYCSVLALTAHNRAVCAAKFEIARVYAEWLSFWLERSDMESRMND